MIRTASTTPMINNPRFLPITALLVALASSPVQAERLRFPIGTVDLGDGYRLEVSTEKVADWAASRFTLRKEGQDAPLDTRIGPIYALELLEEDFLKIDLDGNGKKEWLFFGIATTGSGSRASSPISPDVHYQNLAWPPDNTKAEANPYCGSNYLTGIVISDDRRRILAFDYGRPEEPLASSSFQVMGPERTRAIIGAKVPENILRASPGFTLPMWQALANYLNPQCERRASAASPAPQRPLNPPQVALDRLKWQDYLPYLLQMHANAQAAYQNAIREGGPDYRTRAIGVFGFTPFFRNFPFDEVDPEIKEPRYTAVLNDYAYYEYVEAIEQKRRHEYEKQPTDYSDGILRESVIPMLEHVLQRDPKRTVAWLNLADAQWEVPEFRAQAPQTYRRYLDLLREKNPKAKPAKQAVQRASPNPSR